MSTPDPAEAHDARTAALSNIGNIGNIGIVGSGAVGGTLARAIAAAGGAVVAVSARHLDHAEALAQHIPGCQAYATPEEVAASSHLVLLAVPDDAIIPVCEGIHWSANQCVVHLSGAMSARALSAAGKRGASVAALHPLMTFTRALTASPLDEIQERLRGCVWALESSDEALRAMLHNMVTALDGKVAVLSENDRIPYHIAGVLASNYVVTLIGAAVALWESFGEDASLAREALLPLLRASVENLAAMPPSTALSGPIARGDLGTLRAHLDWLASNAQTSPDISALRDAYLALARLTVPLAEAKGTLAAERASAIRALLNEASRG
ncbi:MAG TPA: Rossmann-like and DUF2520 domain-containing protein [Ktedonobacterales bacterium]|jgi:predicted short-subunit dehydrogenase-like oxidoreductase (DUF2520 family)|nr:Rossmann-like and DUF2520 domain-containing protein [Ktedonobacterales bacterium]